MEEPMIEVSAAARRHVEQAEREWNARNTNALVLCHTIDCHWRDRVTFLWGREQIRSHLERQARRAIESRILLELWAEAHGRIALRFAREFRDDGGTWFRVYGSEELELDSSGLVKRRLTAANEHPIGEHERALRWPKGPRPADHPTLSELGL
jgi:hypothetical protein